MGINYGSLQRCSSKMLVFTLFGRDGGMRTFSKLHLRVPNLLATLEGRHLFAKQFYVA